jgi:AAA+ ATPase superfamily predicted ATPase
MFINREKELKHLEVAYQRSGAQLLALYGRRRIGKTTLLTHWISQQKHDEAVYWVAYRSSSKILLARFSQALQSLTGGMDPDFSYSAWDVAFRELARLASGRRIVVVIDEWPYVLESVPGIATLLQAAWDHDLKKSRVMLILSGSHYHMMHHEMLAPGGALYGRTTADMRLEAVAPACLEGFLPRYSESQRIETYSVIGGVPKYLEMWNDAWPVFRNIEEVVLSPVTIFRQEPAFLIQDELPEARTYLSILDAIGTGMKTPSGIGTVAGLALPHVGKYLQTLLFLGLVRREVSLDVDDPEHTRTTRYEIADPYLRFHFTFLRPNSSLLEQNRVGAVMQIIRERFEAYVGHTGYEEVCRRLLIEQGDAGELSFVPERVGRIWTRQAEFDVAAIDRKHKTVILGECKWTGKKMGVEVLANLERKAGLFRRLEGYKVTFALFCKSGFEKRVMVDAEARGILLYEGLKRLTTKHAEDTKRGI